MSKYTYELQRGFGVDNKMYWIRSLFDDDYKTMDGKVGMAKNSTKIYRVVRKLGRKIDKVIYQSK